MVFDLAGEAIGSVVRFIGHIFVTLVFEIMVQGVGYIICRAFSRKVDSPKVQRFSKTSTAVGLCFWALFVSTIYRFNVAG